jgi:hypothetical protein
VEIWPDRIMNWCAVISFQGVSAVDAFYELLSEDSLSVMHPEGNRSVAPVEMCPILKALYKILIKRLECFLFLNDSPLYILVAWY